MKTPALLFAVLALATGISASAQTIKTIAGTGVAGHSGDGLPAQEAQIHSPAGIAVDKAGNLFVTTFGSHRLRAILPSGVIITLAGTGTGGFSGDNGPSTEAKLNAPASLKVDGTGNIYIADYGNHRIRRIAPNGIITTVAGTGTPGFSGDGGAATSAQLYSPIGIEVDAAGNLYIGDTGNNRVRKVTPAGVISTLAGSGIAGFAGDGGPATSARLSNPTTVRVDAAGNVFIADSFNNRIRRVTPGGVIETFAGNGTAGFSGDGGAPTAAALNYPYGIELSPAGDLYIGEFTNARIRKVSGGVISTYAGNGTPASSGDGGHPINASVQPSVDLALDKAGNLYFAEQSHHRVRKIVSHAPAAPVIDVVFPGHRSVTVHFTSDGSGPNMAYTAVCGSVATPGLASPIVVTGLPMGVPVRCYVQSGNEFGGSGPSAYSNYVTPEGVPVFTHADPPRYIIHTEPANYTFRVAAVPAASVSSQGGLPPGMSYGIGENSRTFQFNAATRGTWTYVVRAANVHGFVDITRTISVVIPSGPPVITSLVRASGQVTVNFNPPADSGGAPVEDYWVFCGANGAGGAGPLDTSSVVTNVPDNEAGECYMQARTAHGRPGFMSSPVSFPPFGTPDAPVMGTAIPGDGQLTLNFTPPANTGTSPISQYVATCSPAGSASGLASPLVVAGLTNGVAHTCTVKAVNASGNSPASSVSNSVIPKIAQVITFGSEPLIVEGGTGIVSATGGGSGNPVIFTSSTPAICSTGGMNGATVTGVKVGRCVIRANQAGGDNHLAASQQTQFIQITPSHHTVSVSRAGTGGGTVSGNGIDCGTTCSLSLNAGTMVQLTAASASCSQFAGWSGVFCAGGNTGPVCSFFLDENVTVTATFQQDESSNMDPRDHNDDGKGDLLFQNSADGSVQGWLMNGLSATQVAGLLPAGGYTVTHVADLNGDGRADNLIRHTDGATIGWLHNGLSVTGQATFFAAGSGWSIKQTPDLNGDGKADLIVEHTDGRVVGWLMDGLTVTGTATFVPAGTGWSVSKVGDLNGDGKTDLIWQNTNGTVQAWLMDGLTATQTATFVGAGAGWSVKLVGDFNADNRADLVWQHTDGTVQAWLMDGLTVTQLASFVPAGTGWSPVLAGDISGDGKADLFWQHTDGRSQTWLMDGLTVTSLAGFVGAGGWGATHLIDLNGDGRKDVLWKHTDGTVQGWLLNGLTISQIASLSGPGSYVAIPPRE